MKKKCDIDRIILIVIFAIFALYFVGSIACAYYRRGELSKAANIIATDLRSISTNEVTSGATFTGFVFVVHDNDFEIVVIKIRDMLLTRKISCTVHIYNYGRDRWAQLQYTHEEIQIYRSDDFIRSFPQGKK